VERLGRENTMIYCIYLSKKSPGKTLQGQMLHPIVYLGSKKFKNLGLRKAWWGQILQLVVSLRQKTFHNLGCWKGLVCTNALAFGVYLSQKLHFFGPLGPML
jgi:hypothetical protein